MRMNRPLMSHPMEKDPPMYSLVKRKIVSCEGSDHSHQILELKVLVMMIRVVSSYGIGLQRYSAGLITSSKLNGNPLYSVISDFLHDLLLSPFDPKFYGLPNLRRKSLSEIATKMESSISLKKIILR